MHFVVDTNTLLEVAALITALSTLFGAVFWIFKFVERQKKHEKELEEIRREQSVLCYGLSACLDGLQQLGANHRVTDAKAELDRHLNKQAHGED